MPRVSTAFVIDDIAPDGDHFWHAAPGKVRQHYWRTVVALVKEAKVKELAEGRDRFGKKLAPISRYTRAHRKSAMGEADPNAPPLTPADAYSRTAAYFDGRAHADRAEFFWRNSWGKVLHYHRVGAKNHWAKSGRLPVRDVIGLSPKSRRWVQKKALAWWDQYRRHLANVESLAKPPPKPPATTPLPLAAKGAQSGARKKKPVPVPQPRPPRPPLTLADRAHNAGRVRAVKPLAEVLQEMLEHEKTAGKVVVAKPQPQPKPPLRVGPAPNPGRLQRLGAFVKGAWRKLIGG